ncbi:MarR family winged helix-turn-helix transcriptional regulator [Nocardia sp. NPDC051052]|uniref:MarR family winged helix-turn-helix transcriptional regulator n=1 Tax=Nocardia sp. NPDC051052 TaxID=3364322 RepID=UPI0037B8A45E
MPIDNPAESSTEHGDRDRLETEIALDIRALTTAAEQLGHVFAQSNNLRPNDFRALTHIATADAEGTPLTAGHLGTSMGVSPAAITYLVDRMISSRHIRRETDTSDRRKVLLRYDEHGMEVASSFFTPLGLRTRAAMADLPEADLLAAHRVLTAVVGAMRTYFTELTDGAPAREAN